MANHRDRIVWDGERTAKLLQLIEQGLTYDMIAQRWGTSATVISDKVRRMNKARKQSNARQAGNR